MPFISKNGTQTITVPSGQKILITSYGAGQTAVKYGTQPSSFPQSFRDIVVIENSSFTSATFTTQLDVLIEAAECEVEYVVAVTPVATRERYQPGSVAITGGTAAFGTLTCSGVTAINAMGATGTGTINLSPIGVGTVTLNPATAGTINNMSIGATVQGAGSFTTLSATGALTANGANVNHSLAPTGTGNVTLGATGTGSSTITRVGSLSVLSTDSSGTPGNATINTLSGRAAFAAAGSTVVITNSLVTANSKVFVQQRTDATLKSVAVVPAAGSFTVTANAAATAITIFDFLVIN